MSEAKDPAIKIFGKKIPVLEVPLSSGNSLGAGGACSGPVAEDTMDQDLSSLSNSSPWVIPIEVGKDVSGVKSFQTKQEHSNQPLASEELSNPDAGSGIGKNPKTLFVDERETGDLKTNSGEDQSETETGNSQGKTLKKPRYWTASGTMRNVSVGAGQRKKKNSASVFFHLTVPKALHNARTDIPNGGHSSLKCYGTVLTFGTDSLLCESMASVLDLADKTMWHCAQNGYHKPEGLRIPVSYGGGEICDDHSNRFFITTSNSKDEASKTGSQEPVKQSSQGFPPQMPSYPCAPWSHTWASA